MMIKKSLTNSAGETQKKHLNKHPMAIHWVFVFRFRLVLRLPIPEARSACVNRYISPMCRLPKVEPKIAWKTAWFSEKRGLQWLRALNGSRVLQVRNSLNRDSCHFLSRSINHAKTMYGISSITIPKAFETVISVEADEAATDENSGQRETAKSSKK